MTYAASLKTRGTAVAFLLSFAIYETGVPHSGTELGGASDEPLLVRWSFLRLASGCARRWSPPLSSLPPPRRLRGVSGAPRATRRAVLPAPERRHNDLGRQRTGGRGHLTFTTAPPRTCRNSLTSTTSAFR